ncbi:hypothetical protein, partial [Klebsiella pneumoniae]|uniref:hypothetical protein n=1 Tax=Klebsiella pneumoniae TaxID=573 RepID=UPI00237A221C
RLKQQLDEDSLGDLEEADNWLDADLGEQEEPTTNKEPTKLELEIDLLSKFQKMAENIRNNAKGDALLVVLEKAMLMTESLGG